MEAYFYQRRRYSRKLQQHRRHMGRLAVRSCSVF